MVRLKKHIVYLSKELLEEEDITMQKVYMENLQGKVQELWRKANNAN